MNNRHILFVDNLIKCKFNHTRAYMATYPDSSYDSARAGVCRLLTNNSVVLLLQDKLKEIDVKSLVTVENVLRDIRLAKELALAKQDLTNYRELCKLEALYLGMLTEKVEHSGHIEYTQTEKDECNRLRADVMN